MRGAGGDRDAGADHAVGAEHADAEIGDVHRAALALAGAARLAVELGHHGAGVGALGDGVAVAAMGRDEVVARREMGADAGGDRLLADREMDGAAHLAALLPGFGGLLEGADARHGPVMAEQALGVDVRRGHEDAFVPSVIRPA
jgi:hypothetical protein